MQKRLLLHLLLSSVFGFMAFGWTQAQNCITTQSISQGSNVYSQIFNAANPIAVDADLNTIVYVHRHNAAAFGGTSGTLRYDISTNGGTTWTSNQGPLNPVGTSPARYPQVAIYNPPANTTPANAYLVYQAPTVATTWNGHVTGVRRLNNTGNTETYNQAASTNTYLPGGLAEGAPGEFWSLEATWNGTDFTGLRVLKGVFANNNTTWSTNATLTPPFNTSNGPPTMPDYSIGFDPSGQFGWIGFLSDLTSAPNIGSLYPVFYRTTDGGQSWSGPDAVDLNSFPCIVNLFPAASTLTSAFDLDLTVDIYGNVHALLEAGIAGTTAYSITTDPFSYMVDITYGGGTYTAQPLGIRRNFRGDYGVAPNTITMDAHSQCSRSSDGSKVFFFWTDSDSVASAGTNNLPDLYGTSMDVVTKTLTDVFDFTSCSPAYNDQAWFPKMSAIALQPLTNRWVVPGTFVDLGPSNDPLQTTDFVYVGNVFFETADYVFNACVNNASISSSGNLCNGSVVLTSAAGSNYLWSNGATTQSITVTQPGTYNVTVSSNCCFAATDSIVVTGAAPTVAAYSQTSSGLSFNFTDASTNSPTSWLWDFGDGNTSTLQNPSHTYAAPGSYLVCLTVTNSCGSDSSCSTVTIGCPAPTADYTNSSGALAVSFTDQSIIAAPAIYDWTFGDGGTSTQQNPTHTYSMPGTYTVCLTVTDQCGTNTFCSNVTVTCPAPVSVWGTTSSGNGVVSFADLSTGNPTAWAWDFGDGNTSSAQNPTHTFAATGSYLVCLTATSACGSNTFCDTVSVTVVGLEDALVQGLQVYPNPGRGLIRVSAELASEGELRLDLVDMTGRRVMALHEGWSQQRFEGNFDLTALPAGLYYLRSTFQGQSGMVKVLLQ